MRAIKTILIFAVFPVLAFFICLCGGVEFGTQAAGLAALLSCVIGAIVAGNYYSSVSSMDI